jgi:glutamine synthetase type III
MAKLKHLKFETDDPLQSYYITLCHVYYFNVLEDNTEKEKIQNESTIETISSLIFHAINIEGTTIREMDNKQYVREYKRFYKDIMVAIKESCKNEVDFDVFLEIIDEIIGAAIKLATAFNKLETVKETYSEDNTAVEIAEAEVEENEE